MVGVGTGLLYNVTRNRRASISPYLKPDSIDPNLGERRDCVVGYVRLPLLLKCFSPIDVSLFVEDLEKIRVSNNLLVRIAVIVMRLVLIGRRREGDGETTAIPTQERASPGRSKVTPHFVMYFIRVR